MTTQSSEFVADNLMSLRLELPLYLQTAVFAQKQSSAKSHRLAILQHL